MNIRQKDQLFIDVITAITEGTPDEYLTKIPVLFIREGVFDVSNIKVFEGMSVIKQLFLDGYLKKLEIKDVNNLLKAAQQGLQDTRQAQVDRGEITYQDVYDEGEKLLTESGIDIETVLPRDDTDEIPDLTVELLESVLLKNTNHKNHEIRERILKSKPIGVYSVEKNLLILKETLENGIPYEAIDHGKPIATISFDELTSTISLRGYNPIQIKKQASKETTREHSVLKFMFSDKDISRKFYYWQFSDNDVYDNNLTNEDYYQICRDINNKIQKEIGEKILECNSEYVQIKPEYI